MTTRIRVCGLAAEQCTVKRIGKHSRLHVSLREIYHLLFDEAFQAESNEIEARAQAIVDRVGSTCVALELTPGAKDLGGVRVADDEHELTLGMLEVHEYLPLFILPSGNDK